MWFYLRRFEWGEKCDMVAIEMNNLPNAISTGYAPVGWFLRSYHRVGIFPSR